jgi:hypothetical protein
MVAGLTYEDGYAVSEGWYIYSLLHDPVELKFFNGIAARDIIKAW